MVLFTLDFNLCWTKQIALMWTRCNDNSSLTQSYNLFSPQPEDFIHTQWWKVIEDITKHLSGNPTGWYPYDVALKIGVSTDHLRVQEDCEIWEVRRGQDSGLMGHQILVDHSIIAMILSL